MSTWSSFCIWLSHTVNLILHSGFSLFFWIRPTWTVKDIPDQAGKVVVVTGANSGTGYATALALYNAGATVYLACRDTTRAQEAAEDIKKGGNRGIWGVEYPSKQLDAAGGKKGKVVTIQLDLSDFASVDRCAEEFLKKEDKLDVLFCNAGIMATDEGQYTKQGYTNQFGTNVLGHHRLITKLLPLLLESPPSKPSRVIISSSAGHASAPEGGVAFQSVVRDASDGQSADGKPKRGKQEKPKWEEYGQSKWGGIAMAKYLAETYGKEGRLIAVSIHPGLIASNLANHLDGASLVLRWAPWLASLLLRTPATGAINQLYAGTLSLPAAWYLNGEYIVPWHSIGIPRPDLEDNELVEGVWKWCDEQQKKYD